MVVDLGERGILTLDSLGGTHPAQVQLMKAFLEEEEHKAAEVGAGPRSPYKSRQVLVPKQSNGFDCGVFTLHFAEKFVSSFSSEGFLTQLVSPLLLNCEEQEIIPRFVCFQRSGNLSNWFPVKEVLEKRVALGELLDQLEAEWRQL